LLVADSGRGWQTFNEDPKLLDAVTAEDVERVANRYFKPENRAVAVYYTKKGQTAEDPLLTGLSDQEKQQVNQVRAMLPKLPLEQVRAMLGQVEQQEPSVPAERKKVLEVVKKLLQERLQKEGGQR
jgi:hypothetical protein